MTRQILLRNTDHDTIKSAIAFGITNAQDGYARTWAVQRWGEAGAPTTVEKAEIPAVSIDDLDATSSSGLIDRALFKAVKDRSLLFRLRDIRRTGFNLRSTSVSNAIATFVAEGSAIPVVGADITNTGLDPAAVAALSVWTRESLESSPGIEAVVFSDLARALSVAIDVALFDPANDGSGVSPASITNGATAISASADFADDVAELISAFQGDLGASYFAAHPATSAGIGLAIPDSDCGARGGELAGMPVLTSRGMPQGQLTLVDPTGIMAAWADEVELSSSREGTVELLDSSLTGDSIDVVPGTAASTVSLWQTNCVGIRAFARVAWSRAREGSVANLTGLAWPGAAS